jgi:hypothetical protein
MTKAMAVTPIRCDRCGSVEVCLYTYEDPQEDYMPMIFCSLDCLATYVRVSQLAAGPIPGGESQNVIN